MLIIVDQFGVDDYRLIGSLQLDFFRSYDRVSLSMIVPSREKTFTEFQPALCTIVLSCKENAQAATAEEIKKGIGRWCFAHKLLKSGKRTTDRQRSTPSFCFVSPTGNREIESSLPLPATRSVSTCFQRTRNNQVYTYRMRDFYEGRGRGNAM